MVTQTDTLKIQDASLILSIAAQANEYTIANLSQNFPANWNVIKISVLPAGGSGNPIPVQLLLAREPIDPAQPDQNTKLVLAFGINWGRYLEKYQDINKARVTIDASLLLNASTAKLDPDFQTTYLSGLRNQVWNLIKKHLTNKDTLILCGMGLATPLAQLAALDLIPTHIVHGLDRSPYLDYQPECFVFSALNFTNQALSELFNTKVTNKEGKTACYSYSINNRNMPLLIDHFPLKPNQEEDYFPLGNVEATPQVKLPTDPSWPGPWLERGNAYYFDMFNRTFITGPRIENQDIKRASGFSQVFAHNLTQLISSTYLFSQHPQAGPTLPGGYEALPTGKIEFNGTLWGRIYTNANGDAILTLRGTTTWEEFKLITSNSELATYQLATTEHVHKGLQNLFYGTGSLYHGTGGLKNAIMSTLSNNNITKVTLTGHDIGGTLLNFLALDLAFSDATLNVQAVYTFGAIPIGGMGFAGIFNHKLKDKVYSVRRIYDRISMSLIYGTNYHPVGSAIIFEGQLAQEENSYHAINGYLHLLDPS